MSRKCLRIGLWHDPARSIFNENTLDCGTPNDSGDGTVALLHEITKNSHGEGGEADVEVLVCHAELASSLTLSSNNSNYFDQITKYQLFKR